jgi:hypothetical protein
MLVTIREVTIDTQGETDLVLLSAQVTQTIRAALAPAPVHLVTNHRGEISAPAQIAAAPAKPAAEEKVSLAGEEVAVPSSNGKADRFDKCACGRRKLVTSQRCRHCAGIAARKAALAQKNAKGGA